MSEPPAHGATAAPPDTDGSSRAPRGRRRLPVGPLGLFLATAVAVAAAYGVIYAFAASSDPEPVELQEALDGITTGPVVPDGTETARIGRPAPDVRLDDLGGASPRRLSELRGNPVVVNFWSSTCAPCLAEMPAFEQVHQRVRDRVTFLGIDVADTVADGRAMVRRTGVTFANARDPRSEILAAFGGTALPRTVLVDADGVVVATHSGALDEDALDEFLAEHGFT
jgi:cytochrome c biogenesis protein CcmG, thiol:disulfide interchange protein DsbE